MGAMNVWMMNNESETESSLSSLETNDTDESSAGIIRHTASNVALLLLCILGTPGNIFVIVVYIRTLTTSMRVYMFSLAVSDLTICVSFTFVSVVPVSQVLALVVVSLLNASMIFSTILLTFLSVERCLAVAHPHRFTLRLGRTKTVVACFAGVSVLGAVIASAVLARGLKYVYLIMGTGFVTVCFFVMVTSYTVMAAVLLTRMKVVRVEVSSVTTNQATSGVHELPTQGGCHDNAVEAATVDKKKAKVAQKVTLIVFIVTIMFILCWLPYFLKTYGLPVSDEMKRTFVVNSVVNPFIYTFVGPTFRRDVRRFCSSLVPR